METAVNSQHCCCGMKRMLVRIKTWHWWRGREKQEPCGLRMDRSKWVATKKKNRRSWTNKQRRKQDGCWVGEILEQPALCSWKVMVSWCVPPNWPEDKRSRACRVKGCLLSMLCFFLFFSCACFPPLLRWSASSEWVSQRMFFISWFLWRPQSWICLCWSLIFHPLCLPRSLPLSTTWRCLWVHEAFDDLRESLGNLPHRLSSNGWTYSKAHLNMGQANTTRQVLRLKTYLHFI